jgi:heme/copper-type cytochrome/quinol oxidase subunit 2
MVRVTSHHGSVMVTVTMVIITVHVDGMVVIAVVKYRISNTTIVKRVNV